MQTAIQMAQIAEPYIRRRAIRHLEKGRVVIFAGGTRQPLLHHRHPGRAAGRRDRGGALLKGTHSGATASTPPIPRTNPTATKLDEVTYLEVLNQGLRAMDTTAITLCMDNHLPIVVFGAHDRRQPAVAVTPSEGDEESVRLVLG